MRDAPPTTLRAALKRAGVSQAKLAWQLDVSPSQVNQWVSGRRSPNAESLQRIEEALGCALAIEPSARGRRRKRAPLLRLVWRDAPPPMGWAQGLSLAVVASDEAGAVVRPDTSGHPEDMASWALRVGDHVGAYVARIEKP